MYYLYIVLSVFMGASASVFGKYYNKRNAGENSAIPLYNFLVLLSVFIGWCVLFAFNFSFDIAVLPYSILLAFSYTVCDFGTISALKYGPASLTALFVSLSLLLTTIWGFIFWKCKTHVCRYHWACFGVIVDSFMFKREKRRQKNIT